MNNYFELARREAQKNRDKHPYIAYTVGAVAVRKDGVVVHSTNLPAKTRTPCAHAEARVMRKAGRGAKVYVARISADGDFRLAKPCPTCEALLKARGVAEVWYTDNEQQYNLLWRTK